MACGAFPISSRYEGSVLPNLTDGYDLGPTRQLTDAIASDARTFTDWVVNDWMSSVFAAYHNATEVSSAEAFQEYRSAMKGSIRKKYTWKSSARMAASLFRIHV
jgi:hypothetical protein